MSYGTNVTMTMMALHPDTIGSAVLDSINPPDPNLPPWSLNVAAAREAFFASCVSDPACRAEYPGLAGTYREVVDMLSRAPPTVNFPHAMGRPEDQGPLTPALFAFVVGRLVYYPTFYPGLPRLISAARDGDTGPSRTPYRRFSRRKAIPRWGPAGPPCRGRLPRSPPLSRSVVNVGGSGRSDVAARHLRGPGAARATAAATSRFMLQRPTMCRAVPPIDDSAFRQGAQP